MNQKRGTPLSGKSIEPRGRVGVFASGLCNPNGLTFEAKTGALWAIVNERDELGPDLVSENMTSVRDGARYCWLYSYYGQHGDPRGALLIVDDAGGGGLAAYGGKVSGIDCLLAVTN